MFKNTRELVLTSMIGAIIIVLSVIPQLGFITVFPSVSITIVHIPVLVGVMLLDRNSSLVLGLLHGLGSLFAAYTRGATPVDLAFINPLISVLPRILFAYVAYELFRVLKKMQHKFTYAQNLTFVSLVLLLMTVLLGRYLVTIQSLNLLLVIVLMVLLFALLLFSIYAFTVKRQNVMYISVTSFFATLLHTIFVLSALVLVRPELFNLAFGDAVELIYTIMVTNGLLEAVLALFVVTPIVRALYAVMERV